MLVLFRSLAPVVGLFLLGESAEVAGEVAAGGVLSGFQVLNLSMESG